MGIAFFDLDRTLLGANSAVLWFKSELRARRLSRWQALKAAMWMARYQLGLGGMEEGLLRAVGTLEGSAVDELRQRTRAFYDAKVRALYRPRAREVIGSHRQEGDLCVLLTSSSLYMAERVVEELGLDAALCNRFEVDRLGRHTGRPEGELCFGEGKLRHARTFADEKGVPLSECTFYTDSFSDLPVMEAVGKPVAVNPDLRLRRTARARGWPVEDWGLP